MARINELALTFLINAAWQVAALTLAASVCARLLRRAPARFRHALWVATLALAVALPLWSLYGFDADVSQANVELTLRPTGTERSLDAPPTATTQSESVNVPRENAPSLESLLHRRRQTLPNAPPATLVIVVAYALFLLYRFYALSRAWRRTQGIRRSAYLREMPPEMKAIADECAATFGLKDVRIECSHEVDAPATVGALRPLIILPESFYECSSAETLASVFGHEMAHVARRDFALNLVYEVLRLPVSFHPFAALLKRQINRTRELACDELVAGRVLEASTYARSLVRVASSLTSRHEHAYTLGVFDGGNLEERVMRLTERKTRLSLRAGRVLAIATFSLLTGTAMAASLFSLKLENKTQVASLATPLGRTVEPAGERAVAQTQEQPKTQHETKAQPSQTPVDAPEKMTGLAAADASERAVAACALGQKRAVEAIPALVEMLGDDAGIRQPVKCWENDRWSPALETFKQASPGEEAALALAQMGGAAVEPLTNALGHTNASVRRNAAWAIGEITGGHS
ncbi:MAG TPA: M56 family metallopeptidase, partial [Pyrinomonadaceae bacterium]|nr:M56 family metallopeptidase [Pyrinomonadaceae bacterium]